MRIEAHCLRQHGEGHTLTTVETRRITAVAIEEAAQWVPIITGIITDSTRSAIERGRAVADLEGSPESDRRTVKGENLARLLGFGEGAGN